MDSFMPYIKMLKSAGYQSVLRSATGIPLADWQFLTQDELWIQEHSRVRTIVEQIEHASEIACGIPMTDSPVELRSAIVATFVAPVNTDVACYIIGRDRLRSSVQLRSALSPDQQELTPAVPPPTPAELKAWVWYWRSSEDYQNSKDLIASVIASVTESAARPETGEMPSAVPGFDDPER